MHVVCIVDVSDRSVLFGFVTSLRSTVPCYYLTRNNSVIAQPRVPSYHCANLEDHATSMFSRHPHGAMMMTTAGIGTYSNTKPDDNIKTDISFNEPQKGTESCSSQRNGPIQHKVSNY
jgi:hypothetical protein